MVACIVGDGGGLQGLRDLAGEDLGVRVFLPGRVPAEEVPDYLAAFDLASLSQSTDAVGSFRYTTKLSEYLAAGLPVITGETPLAYDLDEGYMWRLPGHAPWSADYVRALTRLLAGITRADVERRAPGRAEPARGTVRRGRPAAADAGVRGRPAGARALDRGAAGAAAVSAVRRSRLGGSGGRRPRVL